MSMYGHNSSYTDGLAHKKRRRFFIRLYSVMAVLLLTAGAFIYGFFYSGWLDITSITIAGFKSIDEDQLSPIIRSVIENGRIPLLGTRYGKNTYLFDQNTAKEHILAQFEVIKDVQVKKEYPHSIRIEITERTPVGTWCFVDGCSYFDNDGVLWGKALRSSGSLFLTIEDNRIFPEHQNKLDGVLLENILSAIIGLKSLNIKTNKVVIRPDSIDDFYVYTIPGYYVMFSQELSVAEQIEVFKIFLEEKGQNFKAEYVDLRIKGRIYYK